MLRTLISNALAVSKPDAAQARSPSRPSTDCGSTYYGSTYYGSTYYGSAYCGSTYCGSPHYVKVMRDCKPGMLEYQLEARNHSKCSV